MDLAQVGFGLSSSSLLSFSSSLEETTIAVTTEEMVADKSTNVLFLLVI